MRLLTPYEYPDGDGIVLRVVPEADGRFTVSDGGDADATLAGLISSRALAAPAAQIVQRFDVAFDRRQIKTTVEADEVADACQRIAQAATSLAEASTYLHARSRKEPEFVDVITGQLTDRAIGVERERSLEGASGHFHTASLFVPATETVIEPIGGERAWQVASAVYVEFGDLSQANGYRLLAVLDDREMDLGADISSLLGQVADVARWRQHETWIGELGRA